MSDLEMKTTVSVSIVELRDLLNERAHLMQQVDELQARMTAMAESTLARHVRAFHAKFGHPIATTPAVPDDDTVRFRLRLIAEEFFELLEAALSSDEYIEQLAPIRRSVQRAIASLPLIVDLPEFADALADLDYVIEGTRAVFGIHGQPIADAVHSSNMAKDPNGPDGKPVKPPSWKAPDVVGCLRAQGWVP